MEKEQKKIQDIFSITTFGYTCEVKLDYETYRNNGTLALQLNCKPAEEDLGMYPGVSPDNPYVEPYGVVTVNLPESEHLNIDEQFVDINNLPGVDRWLIDNNIAKPTGMMARSGYCVYPAYKFNAPKEALEKVMERKREIAAQREPLLRHPSAAPKMR